MYFDRRRIYACTREKRDIFVIHTRPELVSAVQFFAKVKLAKTPSILARFISHPHCRFPFPFPCLRFPYPEELVAPPSSRKRARTIVTKLESFTDRSHVQAELLSPLLLSFSFCNSSHSSSWPRFVKVYVSTFIVQHDTEIYSNSLAILSYFFSIALCNFRFSFSLSFF